VNKLALITGTATCQGQWQQSKYTLIMRKLLIMQELLIVRKPLIMRKPVSWRSWTSEVFNTLITLDTYQFSNIVASTLKSCIICIFFIELFFERFLIFFGQNQTNIQQVISIT
jgi:hypothetical protein